MARMLSLFLFLFFAILATLAYAQEDFKAFSARNVELCPCSNQAYSITVENTGKTTSSYKVLASVSASEWITFKPNRFVLAAGQKGNFLVIVNSVCNLKGIFNLEIFIVTDKGLAKAIKQELNFSECYDYSFGLGEALDEGEEITFLPYQADYNFCKNEKKVIPLLVENKEKFENRYRLLLDAPEWAKLNIEKVRLKAKSSGIALVSTANVNEGSFNFNLNTISEIGELQRKKSFKVNVRECYILDVSFDKEKDTICGGEENSYNAIIENTGAIDNEIVLELDAPEWVVISNSFFYIESGETKDVILNAKPDENTKGSFLATLYAKVQNKTVGKSINLEVVPKAECYKADVSAKSRITNYYSKDIFFVKVKNNGIKKANYTVNVEGVEWVSAKPTNLELNPGETGNINVEVNPGEDIEEGTYNININLEARDISKYSKSIGIVMKKESEFLGKLKSGIRFYRYYFYILLGIIVLFFIFRKPLKKSGGRIKEHYRQYRIKRQRIKALKLARAKRQEKLAKERELEERKKEPKKEKIKKIPFRKFWLYALILIFLGIFFGHYFRLFNVRYASIYLFNFLYGYLYYLLIGIGIVVAIFFIVLLYNYFSKKKNPRREDKKAGKKVKRIYKWVFRPTAILIFIAVLVYVVYYFGYLEIIRDFFIFYINYIIAGFVILAFIIFLIRFYKPLVKMLKE